MIILILQRPSNCNKFSYSLIYNPAVGHNLVLDVYDDVELQMVRSSVDHLKARDGPPASWASSTGQNLRKFISVQMSNWRVSAKLMKLWKTVASNASCWLPPWPTVPFGADRSVRNGKIQLALGLASRTWSHPWLAAKLSSGRRKSYPD